MNQRFEQAPVYPGALLQILRDRARLFAGQELLVIENGCIGEADGIDRATYIRRHVAEVERARNLGLPVTAYICWSITTNREWGLPLSPASDFGLYRVNLDGDPGLARIKTPSADAFASLIRASR